MPVGPRFRARPPSSGATLRRAIHAGALFRFAAGPSSRRLRASVLACLEPALGHGAELRTCHLRLPGPQLLDVVAELRARLAADERVRKDVRALLTTYGIDLEDTAIDAPRLRLVVPFAHRIPEAAPAYFAHRDTWYANPDAQLNWWMPLHAVSERDSFVFHPDVFAAPVDNDSQDFDYREWKREVGFQARRAKVGASYPRATDDASTRTLRALPVTAQASELIVFSAAHLHRTTANETARCRISVDFRTVDLSDHRAGRGAPDVDDRSRGSTLDDYATAPFAESAR